MIVQLEIINISYISYYIAKKFHVNKDIEIPKIL